MRFIYLVLIQIMVISCSDALFQDNETGSVHHSQYEASTPKTLYVSKSESRTTALNTFTDLQKAIDSASDGDTIQIDQGIFEANPKDYHDPECANCSVKQIEESVGADTTTGFIINKSVNIVGASKDLTILKTNAGYGVLIEHAGSVSIQNLSITGGKRSLEHHATDGAIVARNSKVHIEQVKIINNNGLRPGEKVAKGVGVAGIVGRTGAALTVKRSFIMNNSWDGIVFYNDAKGEISDNFIKKGRGVGIAATHNAQALIVRNHVEGYWKGISGMSRSKVQIFNNLVVNQSGWGITTSSSAPTIIANNVVFGSGNCGLTMWRVDSKGTLVNNIVFNNGTKADTWVCPHGGIVFNQVHLEMLIFPWDMRFNYSHHNHKGHDFVIWQQKGRARGEDKDQDLVLAQDSSTINRLGIFTQNFVMNPEFANADKLDFRLSDQSALIDSGDPQILDPDGSRSDPGIYGGPYAWSVKP